MTVYLLHLTEPLPRGVSRRGTVLVARHYLGYADDLASRLAHHANGTGARMLAVARERGIGWTLARVWPDAGRDTERKLKRRKEAPRLCPICRAMKGAGHAHP
jgi:hypothetical protein